LWTIWEVVRTPTPFNRGRIELLEPGGEGKSAIKRSEIAPTSPRTDLSGSASIKKLNLCDAKGRGIWARMPASTQGSIFKRTRAERTVSGTSPLPPSINANRNSSNSPPGDGECIQKTWLNTKYRVPDNIIAAGRVRIHASAMLRSVDICSPDPFAAIVPATPDESTWVVDTGSP
jgi:hypothetical protein